MEDEFLSKAEALFLCLNLQPQTPQSDEFDMKCAECGTEAHSDWAEWYSDTLCFNCYQALDKGER